MKNTKKRLLSIIGLSLIAGSTVALSGCTWFGGDEVTYTAASEFFWSSDAGATYGNRTKEYEVGENVYMQLIVKVESTAKKQEEVGVTLTIPYVQDVASKYMDGQIITPEVDDINHVTIYNFTVISSQNASETNFVFKFVPLKATDITIVLEFDDKVSPLYDKQNTITFIEAQEE